MDITVIGLGLIGGSVAEALSQAGHKVTGHDADPLTRDLASATSALTIHDTVASAVQRADLVILAVPLPAVDDILDKLAHAGYEGLLTDVTSVKTPIRMHVSSRFPAGGPVRFIGGHPMAGREISGFASRDPELFRGCPWVLCLEPDETSLEQWLELAALITHLGAHVVPCTAAEHDQAVAMVSHVPHMVAAAIAARAGGDSLALALAAGSFRDGTRVAASRPELVAAMCGGNALAVGSALDTVMDALAEGRALLSTSDPAAMLVEWLSSGHAVSTTWRSLHTTSPLEETLISPNINELLIWGKSGGWITGVSHDRRKVHAACFIEKKDRDHRKPRG